MTNKRTRTGLPAVTFLAFQCTQYKTVNKRLLLWFSVKLDRSIIHAPPANPFTHSILYPCPADQLRLLQQQQPLGWAPTTITRISIVYRAAQLDTRWMTRGEPFILGGTRLFIAFRLKTIVCQSISGCKFYGKSICGPFHQGLLWRCRRMDGWLVANNNNSNNNIPKCSIHF